MTLRRPEPPLAYRDGDFLDSDEARPVRILSEYLQPLRALRRHRVRDTIVFFGSARLSADGPLARYYAEARELARRITEWSKALDGKTRRFLVCTGGGGGIMEAANRGASEAGAPSIGFNITLPHEQEPNPYSTPDLTFRFHYFAMRKMHLAMRANAIAVFPGGYGTLDELFEILTLQQTRKAPPMPVVLIGEAYWRSVVNFDALVKHNMIDRSELDLFAFADDAEGAWAAMVRRGLMAHSSKPS